MMIKAKPVICTLAMLWAVLGSHGALAAEKCFSEWSKAAPLVKQENLATAADVAKLAKQRKIGRMLSISLCEKNGTHNYKVVVSNNKGQIKTIEVDAKKPFEDN